MGSWYLEFSAKGGTFGKEKKRIKKGK